MNNDNLQGTIKESLTIDGIGLHTGKKVKMTITPSAPDSGISFQRNDLSDKPVTRVSPENVEETKRGTNLKIGNSYIHTIEHFMAACYGAAIDNAMIIMDGPEPPVLDGSPYAFYELLSSAGREKQNQPRTVYRIKEPHTFSDDNGTISAFPHHSFKISYTLMYSNQVIGYQHKTVEGDRSTMVNELFKARTFCLKNEVKTLQSNGLALGGSLDNAVVVDDNSVLNEGGLRFKDEFVRHKMADLTGDLAIAGGDIQGQFLGIRSGHFHNIRLLKDLFKEKKIVKVSPSSTDYIDILQIYDIIPHRYPFLLVDRIIDLEMGKHAVGIKNVSINEPFFQGHFPEQPVFPGVLMVEALAQVAGVCILSLPAHKGKTPFFTGLDKVKFRKPIVPGDQVRMEITVEKIKGIMGRVSAKATVEGKVAVEGILKFTVM
jgi:UDP-3-O-[3-hydroxymyristoyl] N-acetylglucosamine deacetylase/3-hydroxyacyl-[acyl-carrier-protein] dehydratase